MFPRRFPRIALHRASWLEIGCSTSCAVNRVRCLSSVDVTRTRQLADVVNRYCKPVPHIRNCHPEGAPSRFFALASSRDGNTLRHRRAISSSDHESHHWVSTWFGSNPDASKI